MSSGSGCCPIGLRGAEKVVTVPCGNPADSHNMNFIVLAAWTAVVAVASFYRCVLQQLGSPLFLQEEEIHQLLMTSWSWCQVTKPRKPETRAFCCSRIGWQTKAWLCCNWEPASYAVVLPTFSINLWFHIYFIFVLVLVSLGLFIMFFACNPTFWLRLMTSFHLR